jgi:hypothetical protein
MELIVNEKVPIVKKVVAASQPHKEKCGWTDLKLMGA